MDIPRPDLLRRKKKRRLLFTTGGILLIAGLSMALSHLKPARPVIARSAVWTGIVQRGDLVREVRGLGRLVPEDIQWIAAASEARVEKIHILAGSPVTPDTILLTLSNPELAQAVLDAEARVTSAEAELVNLQAQLQSQLLERESEQATAQGDLETAQAELAVNRRLSENGLISSLELTKSQITLRQLITRADIASRRVAFARTSITPQLAVQESTLAQARAQATLRQSQLSALVVKATMNGILQEIAVQPGQRVTVGANLARVADPSHLQAEIRIPESQARDIAAGMSASIDTRNGLLAGRIARVDPLVQNGTVTVDVQFTDTLPPGLRPDQNVEGVVQIEKLQNVLQVERPSLGVDGNAILLFKMTSVNSAQRTAVQLGRGSVTNIEINSGLKAGDEVILSEVAVPTNVNEISLQ